MLRKAAQDNVITEDEIIAYGQTLPKSNEQKLVIPGEKIGKIQDFYMPAQSTKRLDIVVQFLKDHDKEYANFHFTKTKYEDSVDVLLSTQQLEELYWSCNKVETNFGLQKHQFFIENTDSSSSYSYNQKSVFFAAKEELTNSSDYIGFTIGHELGHGHQASFRADLAEERRSKSGLTEKQFNCKYHFSENYADSMAIIVNPLKHTRGAYRLFLGNKIGKGEDICDALQEAAQEDTIDVHASNLYRLKHAMLIAGHKLR